MSRRLLLARPGGRHNSIGIGYDRREGRRCERVTQDSSGDEIVKMASLPRSMKAVRLFEYGQPEVLQYIEVPLPEIAADEALVQVRATSVSNWDLRYRRGGLTPPPGRPPLPLPFQPGREAAGEVVAVGPRVSRFKPGDRVVAMTCPACGRCDYCMRGLENLCLAITLPGHQRFGGYAQYVSRKDTELLRAPDNLPFEKLACLLWSYATVWRMAMTRGNLRPGQDVLITAASSGMGTAALQIARLGGARRIFATTGTAEKSARLKQMGADHVLDYREEDVPARLRQLTGGPGVDLVLEFVGGDMFVLGMQCLRMAGTLVSGAQHGGRFVTIDLDLLYRSDLAIQGARASTRQDQERVLALCETGKLDPVIGQILPLRDAVEAHRIVERQQHIGKIVLVP